MRRNPLAPIFAALARIPPRILESLEAHPTLYNRVSQGLAGGIGATIGLVLSLGALITIAILQSLKLIGGIVWAPEQAILFVVLAVIVGFIWGFGVLVMRPGVMRMLLGAIAACFLATALLMIFRWLVGFEPWSLGATLLFAGFAAAFGVVWGMGGFRPENQTVEAAHEAAHHPQPAQPIKGAFDAVKFNAALFRFIGNRILPIIRPLLGPAVIALGIALLAVVVIMVVSAFGSQRVQTDRTSASAVTIRGYVDGLELFGGPVSKFGFFIFIALLIVGGVGSMALGLALIVNALSTQVQIAKKLPKEPLDLTKVEGGKSPIAGMTQFFVRLLRFFTDWVADITGSATRSISR